MRFFAWAPSRALITVAAATGAAMSVALLGAAPASAHVHVDADGAVPGDYAVLTFQVPNESEKGALTTQLDVTLPNVASASTEAMPGWTARLDRDVAAGTVRSVTWTAAPGTGIAADQFALFRISVKLPDQDSVSFPAVQTYSDGTVVRWDQAAAPGAAEPDYPVPTLDMSTTAGEHHQPATVAQAATADTSNRWLAGGALVVATVALAAALLNRRRT
jgi:uncharacterized protein YcnI